MRNSALAGEKHRRPNRRWLIRKDETAVFSATGFAATAGRIGQMADSSDMFFALLARYVAGGLPAPARVLVESHLALRASSRPAAAALETLAGEALSDEEPVALARRQQHLDAIFASRPPATTAPSGGSDGLFPKPLRDFVGLDPGEVPWRRRLPGFKVHDIGEIDGCSASLFLLRPGRALPEHGHQGTELFLVLDGAFNDRFGRFARGDISIADETVDHRPVAEAERPCIGFMVMEGKPRLGGPLRRRLGDILGF